MFFVSGPLVDSQRGPSRVGHNQSYSTSVRYNCFVTEKPTSRKHQQIFPTFLRPTGRDKGLPVLICHTSIKTVTIGQREHNEKKNYGEHLTTYQDSRSVLCLTAKKKSQIMLTKRIFQCNHRNYCEFGYLVQ